MKYPKFIILAALVASLSSCSIEKSLGRQFVEQQKGTRMAVYFPEKAVASNQYNSEYQAYSNVLDGFNQDLFLDVMYAAFADAMTHYDVEIYLPDDPDNVKVDSANWLVVLSKMEITGSLIQHDDVLFDDGSYFAKSYPLNNVNIASWFELNNGTWLPVQFGEIDLKDGFRSSVDGYSINDYKYQIDTLTLNDVYNVAVYLGKTYAGYVYDCFLNDYVVCQMKRMNVNPYAYLRYDPYKKSWTKTSIYTEDKFIEIVE